MKGASGPAILLMLVAALGSAALPAADSGAATDRELVGLWRAHRHFGPEAHRRLVIERTASGWNADFGGRKLPVHADGATLTFELPNGGGSFSGRLEPHSRLIAGHWTQPRSVVQGFQFAVPVRLAPQGARRWAGTVEPRPDECTVYLMVSLRPDGSLGAFLRNPDRNLGLQYGIDQISRDGNALTLSGRPREQGVERAVLHGRFDPAGRRLSIEFPDQGGVYEFTRDENPQSGFYPRGRAPRRYAYQRPPALADGWPTGTLAAANIDLAGIERFVQRVIDMPITSVHTEEVEAVLIARHGRLVLEEYFHGFGRDTLHDTRSAAKSITAVVAGAAMRSGAPLALTTPVYELMSLYTAPADVGPWKRAMRLEDLLTMRSGFYCNDADPAAPGNEDTMIDAMLDGGGEPDFYRYVLKVPMAYAPDTESIYCSTNPNLVLGMVARATGESPLDTFDRAVGKPLQIEHYAWPLDGVGHPYGGGGIRIRPRDFMKVGQLMLNGGTWQGRRIMDADFVARASAPLHDLNLIQYGYLWWSISYPYKNRTLRAYFAGGNGGQGIMVVPELDLVIGIFAGNYADRVGVRIQQELPPNFILPAVRERGDAAGASVKEGDFRTPYGRPPLSVPTSLQN